MVEETLREKSRKNDPDYFEHLSLSGTQIFAEKLIQKLSGLEGIPAVKEIRLFRSARDEWAYVLMIRISKIEIDAERCSEVYQRLTAMRDKQQVTGPELLEIMNLTPEDGGGFDAYYIIDEKVQQSLSADIDLLYKEHGAADILKWKVEVLEEGDSPSDLLILEKYSWLLYSTDEQQQCEQAKENKRHEAYRRHRQACRKVAQKMWTDNPLTTIITIIRSSKVNEACDRERYAEKTIRKWIKDLCPDRSPGRRTAR